MELREKIIAAIGANEDWESPVYRWNAERMADAILDIPEIKEALRSKCSSCDGARGPLLCTECVRDFIKAE